MQPLIEGFLSLSPTLLLAAALGVLLAQFVAVVPGLGGAFLLAVLLPFLFGLDPLVAIAVMVAASVTTGSGNTVTSVVFGVPGSPMGVATVFDGYPMAKQGLAGRAIGAGMMASLVGGVIGAVALLIMIPVIRPFVLAIGAAEFFVLIVIALYAIAMVREESLIKGLVSGGLGIVLSFVGQERSTGVTRLTFGETYLFDGIHIVPFMIGLFAVAEMIDLIKKRGSIAEEEVDTSKVGGVIQGCLDVFRHWRATVQSSVVGLLVGILPGLGGSAAQFMAYAQVAKMSKEPEKFGRGSVEGVIAADAATNSKDGGALIPSLAFGIPGSASMAILLAAFITFGVQPGPRFLEENQALLWTIIFVLIFANLVATVLILSFTRFFVKLTKVRASLLVPVILVISLFGAFATNRHVGDIWVVVGIGLLGYAMKKYNYSRATFVIGFVLGPLLESNLQLSLQLFGPWFLWNRPIARAMVFLLLLGIVWSIVRSLRERSRATEAGDEDDPAARLEEMMRSAREKKEGEED